MSNCNSCGAAIEWAISDKTGKRMPLDAETSDRGTIRAFTPIGQPEVYCRVIPKRERERGELLYTSHFATCPNAKQHRKAK